MLRSTCVYFQAFLVSCSCTQGCTAHSALPLHHRYSVHKAGHHLCRLSVSLRVRCRWRSTVLQRYPWHLAATKHAPHIIAGWVARPTNEPALSRLEDQVEIYYKAICKEMKKVCECALTLRIARYVNSKQRLESCIPLQSGHQLNRFRRSNLSHTPFEEPSQPETTKCYTSLMMRAIAYTLRVATGLADPIELAVAVKERACELVDSLSNGGDATDSIHALIMALLTTENITSTNSCPGVQFIMFYNIRPSGQVKDPAEITPFLAALQWTLRATAFHEMLSVNNPLRNQEALNGQ